MDAFVFLKYFALAYLLFFLSRMLYEAFANLAFIPFVWKRARPVMYAEAFGMVVFVFATIFFLMVFVPYMDIGWMNLFSADGGNIILTPIADMAKTGVGLVRYAPIALLAVLCFIAPFIAKTEEVFFRYGHTEWGAIVRQSIKFGMIHLVIGIPIAAGVALSFLGLFLGYKYRKIYLAGLPFCGEETHLSHAKALAECITYHTIFDTALFAILIAGLVFVVL